MGVLYPEGRFARIGLRFTRLGPEKPRKSLVSGSRGKYALNSL
jgi:hypothetical protein